MKFNELLETSKIVTVKFRGNNYPVEMCPPTMEVALDIKRKWLNAVFNNSSVTEKIKKKKVKDENEAAAVAREALLTSKNSGDIIHSFEEINVLAVDACMTDESVKESIGVDKDGNPDRNSIYRVINNTGKDQSPMVLYAKSVIGISNELDEGLTEEENQVF